MQILNQLSSIGKWLDVIEKKEKTKTNDASKIKGKSAKSSAIETPVTLPTQQSMVSPVPNLHVLRSDALIQAQVEQRLRDLVDENKSGTKIKSLRGGSIDVVVSHRVKWPQEYVLSCSKKERVQYDQLTTTQWMAGFCRIMKEENNLENKEHMLDYLIQLLELQASQKIDQIRRANAQRYVVGSSLNQSARS